MKRHFFVRQTDRLTWHTQKRQEHLPVVLVIHTWKKSERRKEPLLHSKAEPWKCLNNWNGEKESAGADSDSGHIDSNE
ncbi:hypothetical protein BT69DRAFT_1280269 [Atractiella rhizophila]|nr:hypothetical protein BT69DRAFT_1280269 [Atractiella rhizophila]